MLKHVGLASALLSLCRNGVLSQVETTKSLTDLAALQPGLVSDVKDVEKFCLQMSRGIRTLLGWFCEYRKGPVKKQLSKQATGTQIAALDAAAKLLILRNYKPNEVFLWSKKHPKHLLGLFLASKVILSF